jgi:membrane-bound serine protease (ClpP class)
MPRRAARLLLGAVLALAGLAAGSGAALAQAPPSRTIVQLELSGVVDGFVADYLTGAISRAQDAGDQAVLIQIDTPGGLDSSMREITQGILSADIPVICYVAPSGARAASAGAFILESCPVAAMAPGTNVGAATPIGLNGGDLANKIANDAAAYMRTLAETYGRNADVAASFVTDATSITADEALAQHVIDLEATSTSDLLAQLDGQTIDLANGRSVTLATADAALQPESMGGFVGFLHTLFDPSLAFIFFWLGLGLIVLELIVPGHVFSGTIGTILLAISLWSFGLLPVRLIGIVLLVASVICYVIELKAPGLGIWGILGTVFLLLGGWFLYDRAGGVEVSPVVLVVVAVCAAGFFGFVVAKVLQLRHVPPATETRTVVGQEGVALGSGVDARGGIVRVAAEEWRAVAPAGPIPGGKGVRVTRIDGLVLTVEPAREEHTTTGVAAPAKEGGGA